MTYEERIEAQQDLLERMWAAYSPTASRNDIEEERDLLVEIENAVVQQGSSWEREQVEHADSLACAIEDYLREVNAPSNWIPDPALRRLREAVESV